MKQQLNLFFKVKTPFNGYIYFSINQDDKQFLRSLMKSDLVKIVKEMLKEDETYYEMNGNFGLCYWGNHDIIRVRDYKNNLEFQKTLIHEINHCVYHHLSQRNIYQSTETTETFSYLFEFLYGEVIEEINKTLKKIKTKTKKKPIVETQYPTEDQA